MAAAPEIIANTLAPARDIPQTWRESFSYWWNSSDKDVAIAQERLLRRLPFYSSSSTAPPDPSSNADATTAPKFPIVGRVTQFDLESPTGSRCHSNKSKRYLNQFSIEPTSSPANGQAPPPTVLLHGYGAGLGFFFMNFQALGDWAARRGGSIYALDWLGMGLSARVPFRVKAKKENTEERVKEAEDFFLDALEEWREKQGFEKMTLVGHSLGGYLTAAYALRHPERVSRLILLSPAGIPRNPNAPNPVQDAQLEAAAEATQESPEKQSLFRRVAHYGWEAGWSPFGVVRSMTFFGPLLVGRYSSWRFKHFTDEDAKDMNSYIWHITTAKGSGEYSISHILAPGAFARLPIVDRIQNLKVPTTFVYGDSDWMDAAGGSDSIRLMHAAGNKDAKNVIIPYAGHHLYLDNPDTTNKLLVRELEKTVPRS